MSELQDAVNEQTEKQARELAAKIKENAIASFGNKKYSKGWSYDELFGFPNTYVVFNAAQPTLTQLLENGHIVANQYGEYGFWPGKRHIGPAADDLADEYEKKIVGSIEKYLDSIDSIDDL